MQFDGPPSHESVTKRASETSEQTLSRKQQDRKHKASMRANEPRVLHFKIFFVMFLTRVVNIHLLRSTELVVI